MVSLLLVSDYFGRKNELVATWKEMQEKTQFRTESDLKFNFYILKSWYPNVNQENIGKVFAKLKSSKSGNGPESYQNWVLETDIEEIRKLAKDIFDQL